VLTRDADMPGDLFAATRQPMVVTRGIAEALERYVAPPALYDIALEEGTDDSWLPSEL
jgi:hypothetical protein